MGTVLRQLPHFTENTNDSFYRVGESHYEEGPARLKVASEPFARATECAEPHAKENADGS